MFACSNLDFKSLLLCNAKTAGHNEYQHKTVLLLGMNLIFESTKKVRILHTV